MGQWRVDMCGFNVKLGDGTYCLQNTFDKPSVWKNGSLTSLSFFFFLCVFLSKFLKT